MTSSPITITDTSEDFLDTAQRIKMPEPQGVCVYLDTIETPATETLDGVATISIKTFTTTIATEARSVSATFNQSHAEDLKKNFGIDSKMEIVSKLVKEDLSVLQNKLYSIYVSLGETNIKLNKWQRFFRDKLKVSMPLYTKNASSAIVMISRFIAIKNRRSAGDFVIVSRGLAAILQEDPMFVYGDSTSIHVSNTIKDIELIGNMNGILIFVNRNLDFSDFKITMGVKTKENNPGVIIGEYSKDIYEIANPDFTTKCVIGSRDIIKSIGSSEKNYYSREIVIGKAPLWKRILQLVPTLI